MKKYLQAVVIGTLLAMLTGCSDEAATAENGFGVEIYSQETENEGAEDGSTAAESEEPEQSDVTYYGTWAVKDYQSAEVSALSTEEIETYLGYTVTYQADAVFQNGQNMNIAGLTYESKEYTEDSLVQEYKANLGEWWNEKSQVMGIYIDSEDNFFGSQFFAADNDTLWIYYEGVFFLARREE
ncbi:MAG: hypothetical protein J6C64_16145 [Lachnospiraceae bacterium]|nr:hypothetical protein [Lachnospiraceae bacterium]